MSGLINSSAVCIEAAGAGPCPCLVANMAQNNETWAGCFSELICEYSTVSGQFCSGHGECDYSSLNCDCDSDYGHSTCDASFDNYQVNRAMLGSMVAIGVVEICVSLFLFWWVWKHRGVSEVKAMSVKFTNITLFGLMLVAAAGVVIGSGYNDVTCVLLEWFTFFGGSLIMGCAALKAYRIASIFHRRDFKIGQLSDAQLIKYLSGIQSITFVLLVIYTAVNFYDGGAYKRKIDESDSDSPVKELRCSSESLTQAMYGLMVCWASLLLVIVLKFGNESQAAGELFKETHCIYIGSNLGTVVFIVFGVIMLFTKEYSLQIAVRGYGTLMIEAILTYLLFAPRVKAVYFPTLPGADGLTDTERELAQRYKLSLSERNGKELMLVLNTIIQEIHHRVQHKIIKIELNEIMLDEARDLLTDLTDLLEDPTEAVKRPLHKLSAATLSSTGASKLSM